MTISEDVRQSIITEADIADSDRMNRIIDILNGIPDRVPYEDVQGLLGPLGKKYLHGRTRRTTILKGVANFFGVKLRKEK